MKTIKRQLQRDILKSIDKRQGAILLTGPGGIGKSTLITQTAAELRQKGFEFIMLRCSTTVEEILEAIALKAESLGVGYAEKFFNAYQEYKHRDFTGEQLMESISKARQRRDHRDPGQDEFILLYLETLFRYLDKPQLKLLEVLAVYGNPVPEQALTAQHVFMEEQDRTKLAQLSLLHCIEAEEKKLYYLHRLTAQYLLETMKGTEKKTYHRKAAGYFAAIPMQEGKVYLHHRLDARRHYLRAKEWNQAAELTIDLTPYLMDRGYLILAVELLRELDMKKLSDKNRAEVHDCLGNIHREFGEHQQALSQYTRALDIAKKINELKGASRYMYQRGNIYYKTGDYDSAFNQYSQALEISDKINDNKGMADSLHQIGILYRFKDDYDAAFNNVNHSLEIKKKIGDSLGIGKSLLLMGMFYYDKRDYDSALNNLCKAREVFEKNNDSKNVSNSLHELGKVYQNKGNDETALEYFLRAFRHFTGAGAPNQALVSLREDIARVRGSLSEEHFNSILQEFNFSADFFDNDEDREQEEFTEFLAALTREAAAAKEKAARKKINCRPGWSN